MRKYTDTELLSLWEEKKKNGVTMRQWAEEFEIPRETLHTWLKRAKKRVDNKQPTPVIETEQVKQIQNGNELEIESNSKRIKTLDDLIVACEIDLEKWQIERHVINKWEVGAKDELNGGIIISPLFQVKAWLKPRKLDSIELTVNPIKLQVTFIKRNRENIKREFKVELVLPDMQFGFRRNLRTGKLDPFHDRLALDIACQIARDIKPDGVTILGDMLDLSEWTDKFIRSPEFYWTTQPAIIELGYWLTYLYEESQLSEIKALEGNHEARLNDALSVHLSAAYQLSSGVDTPPALSVPGLLDFKSLGIKWIDGYPDNCVWLNDDLKLVHGNIVSNEPGLTAKNVVQKSNTSVVFAHVHRRETATRTIYTQSRIKTITAHSPGCLCRIDGIVPGHNKNQNWQNGLAVIVYNSDYHTIIPIAIDNNTAVYNGKMYSGINRIEEIRESTKWAF